MAKVIETAIVMVMAAGFVRAVAILTTIAIVMVEAIFAVLGLVSLVQNQELRPKSCP